MRRSARSHKYAMENWGQMERSPVSSVRLCRRLGRIPEASASYEKALAMARQEPERRFLARRLRELPLKMARLSIFPVTGDYRLNEAAQGSAAVPQQKETGDEIHLFGIHRAGKI
jgi:hypothetical protein